MTNTERSTLNTSQTSLIVYAVPRGIYHLFDDWLNEQEWSKHIKYSLYPTEHIGIYTLHITGTHPLTWTKEISPALTNYFYAHSIVTPVKNTETL